MIGFIERTDWDKATAQWLHETGPLGILITDATLNIHGWNTWLETHSGRPVAKVLGRNLLEVYPELVERGLDRYYQAALAGQVHVLSQPLHRYLLPMPSAYHPGLQRMAQSAYIAPLTEDDRVIGTITIIQDVTERVLREAELRKYSERLEEMVEERTRELQEAQERLIRQEKLAVLGQMAAGVSHELRGPLGTMGNAVYLLNLLLKDADPQVKETLETIADGVRASERIIRSLLDFARTRVLVRQTVNVNHIVQEALSRVAVPEKVEVVCQLDVESAARSEFGTLPTIAADPDQLEQVFSNLILNAVQAMPDGGTLTVRTGTEGIRTQGDSEAGTQPTHLFVSISDTGVGIPEENLRKIFEPLFTTKTRGIGLGLAVCKNLIEAHGGSIEVESEAGKGSTFTVKLPREAAELTSNAK